MSLLFALAVGVAALVPETAQAVEVRIEEWIRKPGVRMVAVQSVPEKCEGCAKEAARWQALLDSQRARGLRIVTVVARDPLLGCVDPGWKPDGIVCDVLYDGIAKRWRLRERSTTAFLWDWKGELLVDRGEIGDVERAVARGLASTPQIVIDIRTGEREGLREALRAAITAGNKYRPASPSTERARLSALGPGSYAIHLELPKCEPGQGLAGDAILGVRDENGRIDLTLRSEAGCRVASHSEQWSSAERAVAALFAKIPRRLEQPKRREERPIAGSGLIADGATPEGQRQRSKQRLDGLRAPVSRQLARALEKYLGKTEIDGPRLARAVLRETFGVDIGETLKAQLSSGPEVLLDLRDPERTLRPGDLVFYVTYAYLPRVVLLYLGRGLIAQADDIRGIVVEPLPLEVPHYFQTVARRPLTAIR